MGSRPHDNSGGRRWRSLALAGLALLWWLVGPLNAAPLRVVAVGASNTHGWYLGNERAYPAQLAELVKARGVDIEVVNAGVPFDTTSMMMRRLDVDVPDGTDLVILQPGANDLRFFGNAQQRSANIAEMQRRLKDRSIHVILFDEDMPARLYTLDRIHFSREGHAAIAARLLPQVLAVAEARGGARRKPKLPIGRRDPRRGR